MTETIESIAPLGLNDAGPPEVWIAVDHERSGILQADFDGHPLVIAALTDSDLTSGLVALAHHSDLKCPKSVDAILIASEHLLDAIRAVGQMTPPCLGFIVVDALGCENARRYVR